MTFYVLLENGGVKKYPYTLTDMRFDNPTISFPVDITDELAADFGVFPVTDKTPPAYNEDTQRLLWEHPVLVNGSWEQRWSVEDIPQEELQQRLENWRSSIIVSPFQAKAALFNAGLLDDVETVISATETPTLVKLAWANATEFRRNSPMIQQLSQTLSLTDTQVDELFKQASVLSA